jgi:hypothetical protein
MIGLLRKRGGGVQVGDSGDVLLYTPISVRMGTQNVKI